MKKHKSVVAILLAVMMIFAMMPAMAFATTWDSDFAHVTDDNGVQFDTKREFSGDTTGNGNGYITVSGVDKKATVIGESDAIAPTDKAYYYDLDGSALTSGTTALNGTTWTKSAFDGAFTIDAETGVVTGASVKLVEPSYADGYKADVKKFAIVDGFNGWTLTVKATGYDAAKVNEDQTVTFSASFKADGDITAKTTDDPDVLGTIASATVTVKGVAKEPADADFYFDSVGGTKIADGLMYDGAAHTVVGDTFDGWTLSYEVYNADTGRYVSASAVSVTDVQDPIKVRATYKKSGKDPIQHTLFVGLIAANGAEVGFDSDKSESDYGCEYVVPGTEYNAADYIVLNAVEIPTSTASTAAGKAAIRAENAATKKAVEANKALLMEYFNAKYEVAEKTLKNYPNEVRLTITKKEMTDEEEDALDKKYEAVLDNVGGIDLDITTAVVYFNDGVYDYEVEFTKAPAGVTTFKANKKGKLAKNKTIQVKAVANGGATVYYKLVNANSKIVIDKKTGKITVKKGLKKGTYTFKVKAYVPGVANSDWYEGYKEFQTVKVKIKK